MKSTSKRVGLTVLLVLGVVTGGCAQAGDESDEGQMASTADGTERLRYTREFIFVSPDLRVPTVVPFTFRNRDDGAAIERTAIAWLGRGQTWDRFLEERQSGVRAGGVWRVVPHGDLTIAAGGPLEIETLRFERAERRLRLDLIGPLTPWTEAGQTRFRLLTGTLSLGSEGLSGPVLEILNIERILDDGWPPTEDFDALFLTSGDSVQLFIAERMGAESEEEGYAWMRAGAVERRPVPGEIRWLEMRTLQDARRDVPAQWSFSIPDYGVEGEVESIGQDVLLGPERGGRRAVEIRYSVQGWYEMGGARRTAVGMIRHLQQ